MSERSVKITRMVSVVAATVVSLACGTNYVYSAWAPQFAEQLHLSSTQSNLLGVWGNLGMYLSGIPAGLLVDHKGPRPGALLGAVLYGTGYMSLHRAYISGPGATALPFLCFFMFITGIGSAVAFSGAVKTAAANWPSHRGTATAFPVSAYGLSAFFFSIISSIAFPSNTSDFLLLLSIGTFSMAFVGMFFLRIVPQSTYTVLPSHPELERLDSNPLHRTKSKESRRSGGRLSRETGTQSDTAQESILYQDDISKNPGHRSEPLGGPRGEMDETSSLISTSSISGPGDFINHEENKSDAVPDSHNLDVRGLALLRTLTFWQMFIMLGLMTGIGLMTINNIGNDAQALWTHYDDGASAGYIRKRQLMHVSILSLCSFTGRLCSGIGSDLIVKRLGMSRFWCVFISSSIFGVAQVCGSTIENPHLLFFVSGLNGLAYGFLFGVYPALVAEKFGIKGMSQNWGTMTLSPVIFGQIFNLIYGRVYDHNSSPLPNGHRDCTMGVACYRNAYYVTLGASLIGMGISLYSIRHEHTIKARRKRAELEDAREA